MAKHTVVYQDSPIGTNLKNHSHLALHSTINNVMQLFPGYYPQEMVQPEVLKGFIFMMSADGKTITRSVKTYEEILSLIGGFFLSIYALSGRTYRFFSEDFGLLKAGLGLADEARFKSKFSKKEFKVRDITNTCSWNIKYFCFRKLFCCQNCIKQYAFSEDG